MVTAGFPIRSTAKRLRRTVEGAPSRTVVMKIVECCQCGQRFSISHNPATPDVALAEKQASWLEERFVWDHIQENKHPGSITLPPLAEMK